MPPEARGRHPIEDGARSDSCGGYGADNNNDAAASQPFTSARGAARHLLSPADRYPNQPGSKGLDGTSQAAAAEIAPLASRLRRIALQTLAKLGEATPLEVVEAAGVAREALQPRLSESRRLGLIEPTGARRFNPSGKAASVLRLTAKGHAIVSNLQGQIP